MSEFRSHTGLSTCRCTQCLLIRCGAVEENWDGWAWGQFSGRARVIMMRLLRREPWLWCGPKTRWAGCVPWLDHAGVGLRFDADGGDEGDDDELA
jgi:hypothetical protein